jgi:hypothetical protein
MATKNPRKYTLKKNTAADSALIDNRSHDAITAGSDRPS